MDPTTPMKAIRLNCVDCSGGKYAEVNECLISGCALYDYKTGHRPTEGRENNFTPMKAIRHKCRDCSEGEMSRVKNCDVLDCPLYRFRLGKKPKKAERYGLG